MNPKQFKQHLLDQLYAPYCNCHECPLGSLGRTHVVFGEGNPDAKLVIIGEGPGQDEDRLARPFVGRSGKLLDHLLEAAGLDRSTAFITNIVKCRPPNNRTPLPNESAICKKILLLPQLKIIRPTIICTLGSAALSGLLMQDVKITKMRGNTLLWEGITLLPTYHPAYILRNPKELPTLAADIQKASDLLANLDTPNDK